VVIIVMLARPKDYLDGLMLLHPFNDVIDAMLNPPGVTGYRYIVPTSVSTHARKHGFYKAAKPGKGRKPLTLTPPPELYSIFETAQHSPVIDIFHKRFTDWQASVK